MAAGVLLAGYYATHLRQYIYRCSLPVNIIIGGLFVAALLITHFVAGRKRTVRWPGGVSYHSGTDLLVLLCVMGVPQFSTMHARRASYYIFFSFRMVHMTTSWPFVLLCFTLVLLGLTI